MYWSVLLVLMDQDAPGTYKEVQTAALFRKYPTAELSHVCVRVQEDGPACAGIQRDDMGCIARKPSCCIVGT